MELTAKELKIISRFYDCCWTVEDIAIKKKPNIASFLSMINVRQTDRIMGILSLFYFRYFSLRYAYNKPKQDEIVEHFKSLN
jgi:hypothetical protein